MARSARRSLAAAVLASGSALLLSACAVTPEPTTTPTPETAGPLGAPISIGYVTPRTGSLAEFGKADDYVIDAMTGFFGDHPITLKDGSVHRVNIIAKDSKSDLATAAAVANELIAQSKVSLILVSSTADTVDPVADVCEANKVVCISTGTPWQAFYLGRGGTLDKGFEYTYHFYSGIEDAEAVYGDIWKATAPADSGVALLLPNDPQGNAWRSPVTGFPPFIIGQGRTPNDPGAFENATTDFSAQIAAFLAANDSIVAGVPLPSDFAAFWTQAAELGYHPTTATFSQTVLFPSTLATVPEGHADNVSTEVSWHPTARRTRAR